MAFADSIKYNRVRSMKGLPIGAILPWSSDQGNIPTGWVMCNGATISNTRYPLLFETIGNAYGGTAGSTYRLPPLTNSQKGIVDVFRGHYTHLKSSGVANSPVSNSITEDPFWNIVATGDGNQGSSSRDSWPSTIDLVGRINGAPQFVGVYDDIDVSDGNFSYTATWEETSLRDFHLNTHSHAYSGDDPVSYRRAGGRASWCTGTRFDGAECFIACEGTSAWRVAANPNSATRVSRGNNQTHLRDNFLFFDARIGLGGTGGGGSIRGVPRFDGGGRGESGATVYIDGNGICGGEMSCGGDVLFTSLSNTEGTGAGGAVAPHQHGTTTYNLLGRYQVLNPGVRTDISLNTVQINNDAGLNFGTITATTATPSLDMMYIIRAY